MAKSETKTVWAIEDGEYSDYHVVGVFSSEENAETVRARVGGTIAEWTLDPGVAQLNAGLSMWRVYMLRDGATENVYPIDINPYTIRDSASIWRRSTAPAYQGKGVPDVLQADVWAKTKTHAVKIVNEKRTQMIANGEW